MAVCARAGCGHDIVALASFDRTDLVVRLRDPSSDDAFTIGLCSNHTARLTVPIGWELADERNGAAPDDNAGPDRPQPRHEPAAEVSEGAGASNEPRRRTAAAAGPEGGLLSRAFDGPDSGQRNRQRRSWLEAERDEPTEPTPN